MIYIKLLKLIARTPDEFIKHDPSRIKFGQSKDLNVKADFVSELQTLISQLNHIEIENIVENSIFGKMNDLITDILKKFKINQKEKISTQARVHRSTPSTLNTSIGDRRLDMKYQIAVNNAYYMTEVKNSLISKLNPDLITEGASISNIWFNNDLYHAMKEEYCTVRDIYQNYVEKMPANITRDPLKESESLGDSQRILLKSRQSEQLLDTNFGKPIDLKRKATYNPDLNAKSPVLPLNKHALSKAKGLIEESENSDDYIEKFSQYEESEQSQRFISQEYQYSKQIYIIDSYVKECFDRLSNHQDSFGRKVMLDINWDFIDVKQMHPLYKGESASINTGYNYIKQKFMENVMHLMINANNKDLSDEEKAEITKEADEYFTLNIEQ